MDWRKWWRDRVTAGSVSKPPPARPPRAARTVRGESHYQDALSDLCGGKIEGGHKFACEADLVPEPDNPHDPNAVAVFIQGRKVGYLPRQSARRFGKAAKRCPAQIVGGWRDASGEGHFGVELDYRA